MFREQPGWYQASKHSFEKWGVPQQIQMAIIQQESSFRANAKPPRHKLFGLLPTVRPSSAHGYAQAKTTTWDWYQQKTGNSGADRNDFADTVDFIGWYGSMSQRLLAISKWDARNQYLAYHEGHGGYQKRTYQDKPWLVRVAQKVESRAKTYARQLATCRGHLEQNRSLWPF